jgi:hypothetical protein
MISIIFLGVKGGRLLMLKISPQSLSQLRRKFGNVDVSVTLWACMTCYRDSLLLLLLLLLLFGLENREYGCMDPWRWPRGTLYPQKLALTSPTSGGYSVGVVRWRTQDTKFSLV